MSDALEVTAEAGARKVLGPSPEIGSSADLDAVRERAQVLRSLRAQADQAAAQLAEACAQALRDHSKLKVSAAAGVSFQAMYQMIGRHKEKAQ